MRRAAGKSRWRDHPARAELRALYAELDVLVTGSSCTCADAQGPDDARCCQFGVTGREPYPTPVELAEVDLAMRARGARPATATRRGSLPMARERGACPLLANDGRCSIYAGRPFGCRTFFCAGHEPPRRSRDAIQALGRRIADLAARVFPRDPLPRPFTRALGLPAPAPAAGERKRPGAGAGSEAGRARGTPDD